MAVEPTSEVWTCYRHPDRRAGVACQRCDRPICPACMAQASVGFHCPECVRRSGQRVVTARSLAVRPLVTQTIIGINLAVFVLDLVAGGGAGVLYGPLVAEGEWWRVVTGGFLHVNLIHLAMNMAVLWMLGGQLESTLGHLRFLLLYGGSLLGGSIGVLLLSPFSPTVGASGAVYGLLGAYVAVCVLRRVSIWNSGIGGLIAINLLLTFLLPGISIGGHLGGLVTGFLLGLLLVDSPRFSERAWLAVVGGTVAVVLLFVGSLATAGLVAG
jgi:membrane associated rhomboid family serine protease